jgi:hypothetical protein
MTHARRQGSKRSREAQEEEGVAQPQTPAATPEEELLQERKRHRDTKRKLARSEAETKRAEWRAGLALNELELTSGREAAILRAEIQSMRREMEENRTRMLAAERTARIASDAAIAGLFRAQASVDGEAKRLRTELERAKQAARQLVRYT